MSRLTGQRTQLYYEQALNQSFPSLSISLSFYLCVVNTSNLGYLFHNRTVPPPLDQRVNNKQTTSSLSSPQPRLHLSICPGASSETTPFVVFSLPHRPTQRDISTIVRIPEHLPNMIRLASRIISQGFFVSHPFLPSFIRVAAVAPTSTMSKNSIRSIRPFMSSVSSCHLSNSTCRHIGHVLFVSSQDSRQPMQNWWLQPLMVYRLSFVETPRRDL
jgi:hypothetical protein